MIVSRAAFVRSFGMALVGARLEPTTFASGVTVRDAAAAQFQPHVGDTFTLLASNGPRIGVTLAKVVERPLTRNVAQFSLFFHGPLDQPVADGIHLFQHRVLGSFAIFISPVGVPGERRVYQACFSRHVRT